MLRGEGWGGGYGVNVAGGGAAVRVEIDVYEVISGAMTT
jgi:hypothetical protein